MTAKNKNKEGSALIMALVVIVILSVLVMSFSFEAKLEAQLASYSRDRLKCTYLAESGIVIANMLMSQQGKSGGVEKADEDNRWFEASERLRKGQPIIGLVEPLGDGFIIVDIEPEPGRLNINLLTEKEWETVLFNIGLPEEFWADIIDPIMDWIDTDDVSRSKGAETDDYYSLLDPPYKAKNGPVNTIREVLLVKNFSEELLTGGIFDPGTLENNPTKWVTFDRFYGFTETNNIYISGIENMMTTYGDGKINIQSAPYNVLLTLPDVDEILAHAIIEEREILDANGDPDPFKSVDDVFMRIDGLSPEIKDKITVNSQYYRITSTGRIGNVKRQMWCIGYYDGTKMRILRWREESW